MAPNAYTHGHARMQIELSLSLSLSLCANYHLSETLKAGAVGRPLPL
jgi:hypothetical protein